MKEFIEKLIGRLEEESYEIELDGAVVASTKTVIELSEVKKIINEIAEEHNGGWIPCEKELPKEAGCYLVSSNAMVFVAYWFNNTWWGIEKRCRWKNIIAWKNLPEPYNPKGE